MKRARMLLIVVASVIVAAPAGAQTYFPGRFDWQHKTPQEVGLDAAAIDAAVKLAIAS